ncbi:MAG: hypothetical protein IJR89_06525 [Clostridia bacterium]|nr:hypothetical protein [Clostridia bacterium]
MKDKKEFSVENVHRAASRKFNPWALCEYLKKDGDINVVDKELALRKTGDSSLFIVALNDIYGWNYEGDFKSVTAYLETDGFDVYGGTYNLMTHSSMPRRLVASTIEREKQRMASGNISAFAPYIYSGEKLAVIIGKLAKTT